MGFNVKLQDIVRRIKNEYNENTGKFLEELLTPIVVILIIIVVNVTTLAFA